jgi:DGQHR domain-containing protein
VLLGFAPASLLYKLSFADVLDEDTCRGYQRRLNSQHSLDFRRYIQQAGSSTIPLTFNLRPEHSSVWRVLEGRAGGSTLVIDSSDVKVLAQVDCQHRIGNLADIDVELPFMCFIGLSEREEMEVFSVINSKARGLSSSLLDFHDAQLTADLGTDRPELYIALFLRHEPSSPWFRQLDLGGSTSGMTRRASLRTIQKAVKQFLARTKIMTYGNIDGAAHVVLDFWAALVTVLPEQWANPRKHLLTKGVGVYALMEIAADLHNELREGRQCDRKYLIAALSDFALEFDWTTNGPLKGLGGEGGVKAAVEMIRGARRASRLKVVRNG